MHRLPRHIRVLHTFDVGRLLIYDYELVVQVSATLLDEAAKLAGLEMREEALAVQKVEPCVVSARLIPLFALAWVVPTFPERRADCPARADATRTGAEPDDAVFFDKLGNEPIEATCAHLMPQVKRVPHIAVDAIDTFELRRQTRRRRGAELGADHLGDAQLRELHPSVLKHGIDSAAVSDARVGHVHDLRVAFRFTRLE